VLRSSSNVHSRRLSLLGASSRLRPDHVRFTLLRHSLRGRLRQWEHTERRNLGTVPAEECPYAASRFSSVVPEWERRNPGNVRRWLREHADRCIRRGSRRAAVLWEWALRALLHRHRLRVLVLRVVLVPPNGRGSVTFHAE
jgi:hypothetical protein